MVEEPDRCGHIGVTAHGESINHKLIDLQQIEKLHHLSNLCYRKLWSVQYRRGLGVDYKLCYIKCEIINSVTYKFCYI